uniref:Uncharacterized protein n=1 Tax=Cyprinus carpio TaxID=7962 RepID=A0A8C2FM32_CYPCA
STLGLETSNEGWTALRSAAWGGHKESVRLLLEAGADIDGCDSDGRTALRAAAWGGHEEILLTLLDHGAQVDRSDREGRTPLIAAAYMGHKEAVEILLNAGADLNLADGDGRTGRSPLILAAQEGHCSEALCFSKYRTLDLSIFNCNLLIVL